MTLTYEEMRTNTERIEDAGVKARVLRGLEILRDEYGDEWVEHINPETLDLQNSARCVLGQLGSWRDGGNFFSELERFGGEVYHRPADFGFDATGTPDAPWLGEQWEWDVLTNAWLVTLGEELR